MFIPDSLSSLDRASIENPVTSVMLKERVDQLFRCRQCVSKLTSRIFDVCICKSFHEEFSNIRRVHITVCQQRTHCLPISSLQLERYYLRQTLELSQSVSGQQYLSQARRELTESTNMLSTHASDGPKAVLQKLESSKRVQKRPCTFCTDPREHCSFQW